MKKQVIALTMAAIMMGSLTACGGSGKTAETTAAAGEAAGGVLTMATNAEFPPYEYHDNNEIVGIDVEIANALAEKLGMTLEIEDIAFDSIIPGRHRSGWYDCQRRPSEECGFL